jgi:uncharacterized protein
MKTIPGTSEFLLLQEIFCLDPSICGFRSIYWQRSVGNTEVILLELKQIFALIHMSYLRSCLVGAAARLDRLILISIVTIAISIGTFVLPVQATAVYEVPAVSAGVPSWVIDKADILSLSTKGTVKGTLEQLAKQTGKEVRFVTIHRLDYGDTIQTFTDKLFKKWFPTDAEQANQALIVLDNVTNTIGIQTGAEVKSTLTDPIATSITDETMQAPLRNGNKYNQAFSDGADRLAVVLSGKPDPGPPVVISTPEVGRTYLKAEETEANRTNFLVIVIGLLIVATVIPMATWWWYQNQS